MDKQHGKRVRRTQNRTESEYTYRFTQNNTKKYQIGKHQAMMAYMDQEIHLHPRQTSTRYEQMPTRSKRM